MDTLHGRTSTVLDIVDVDSQEKQGVVFKTRVSNSNCRSQELDLEGRSRRSFCIFV